MALSDAVFPAKLNIAVPPVLPMRTDREGRAVGNRMLLALEEEEFHIIRPLLEPLALVRYQVLYEQSGKMEYAYFPNDGMAFR